jgi:hypothetical protein
MKLNTLLEYLLREASESEVPEEYAGKPPLGQYLFAIQRTDTPEPKEENTTLESDLLTKLKYFYNSGGSKESEKAIKQLLNLKNQGLYTKLLKPPSGLAYRFVGGLTPEQASKLYLNNLPVEDITSEPGVAFYAEPIGVVKDPAWKSTHQVSKSKLSSWTIDPQSPQFGAFAISGPGYVSVVLVADIDSNSNNFIMNPEQLKKTINPKVEDTLPIDTIIAEQEVIGYGPINCLEAAAIYIKPRHSITYDELDMIRRGLPPNGPILPPDKAPSKGTYIKPTVYKNTLKYINDTISKWNNLLTPKDIKDILSSPHYTLLTKCANEGYTCDGTTDNYFRIEYTPTAIINRITGCLMKSDKNKLSGDKIQNHLISALNLKMKK